MFLQRPSSFLMSATSMRRAAFSFSRKPARIAIWFSFSRRASRDRLAATLFFLRRAQYRSSWRQEKRRDERTGQRQSRSQNAAAINQLRIFSVFFPPLWQLTNMFRFWHFIDQKQTDRLTGKIIYTWPDSEINCQISVFCSFSLTDPESNWSHDSGLELQSLPAGSKDQHVTLCRPETHSLKTLRWKPSEDKTNSGSFCFTAVIHRSRTTISAPAKYSPTCVKLDWSCRADFSSCCLFVVFMLWGEFKVRK